MPAHHVVLAPELRYTCEEMEKIQRGFFSTVMEQKWFLYFSGSRLQMHRSWTGFLIYDVGFAFDSTGGASVTEVLVNRDADQYGNTDDREGLELVETIILNHLLEPLEEPAVDGFAQAVMLASKPNYLGSQDVVSSLVSELFEVAVRAIKEEATIDELRAVKSKVIMAFTDDEVGYTRMPGWHNTTQLGLYVTKYLVGAHDASADDGTLETILDAGLTALLSKLKEMIVAFLEDPGTTWQDHALVQLNELHQYVVTVLLGNNTLSYGERSLSDFHWISVTAESNNKKHCILGLASEGGQIKLVGIQKGPQWIFRVEVGDLTLSHLIDESEEIKVPVRPWVTTWRSALKQLDNYPWPQWQPYDAHPMFRERVIRALKVRQKKGITISWSQWKAVLDMETYE